MRRLLTELLEQADGFRCVGSYRSCKDALEQIARVRPHLLVASSHMTKVSLSDLIKSVKLVSESTLVVLESPRPNHENIFAAASAGADGYVVTEPFSSISLLATFKFLVQRASSGQNLPQQMPGNCFVEANQACQVLTRLTRREGMVMACLARGLLYKEVAAELDISRSAVHKHQHRIFVKLKAGNRTEAVLRWQAAARYDNQFLVERRPVG